jgi:hypothetical protein
MPGAYTAISKVLPFTHFMNLFIKFYFMDTDISSAYPEIRSLLLFSIVSLLIIIPVLYYRTSKYKINSGIVK